MLYFVQRYIKNIKKANIYKEKNSCDELKKKFRAIGKMKITILKRDLYGKWQRL